MIEIPSLRPETRYGIPTADLLLFNRQYVVGYSYLFRQPRWALELIDPDVLAEPEENLERLDNFRPDLRIPEAFRASLDDYRGTGFDRGHLISSADRLSRAVVNSETFLLSNMSPQTPDLNRQIWRELEQAVRKLASTRGYVEVYAICGPLFTIGEEVEVIGKNRVVVPHAFFKSVLAEKKNGTLEMWSFAFPNAKDVPGKFEDYQRSTNEIEAWAGLQLWDRLRGAKAEGQKGAKARVWTKPSRQARRAKRVAKKRKKAKKKSA